MNKMKGMLIGGLIVCFALAGCGSREKKNIVGSTGAAAAVKSQAAGTQTEAATTQGLSALQSVLKALNGQGQRGQSLAAKKAGVLGAPDLTVEYSWNWMRNDAGYYVSSKKDHRNSTFVFKMKQDPDWWYTGISPWNNQLDGTEVRQGYIAEITYDAPMDNIKSTATEKTYWVSKIKYGWPDWENQRLETSGEGRTENTKDGTWMTFIHKGTGTQGGVSTNTYGADGYTVIGGVWSWTTKNIDAMDYTLSTGYSGTFDTTTEQAFSSKWEMNQTSWNFVWDLKLVTDGKILKDGERIANVHIEARNVVDGMRVEGYYTIPEEGDAVKHELDSNKYGFLSKDMFKNKSSHGSMY